MTSSQNFSSYGITTGRPFAYTVVSLTDLQEQAAEAVIHANAYRSRPRR
jgi:hypothetical protein